MSAEIIIVLSILAAVILFLVTEWLPLEVLALLVLGTLAVTGLVSPTEALSGFSNPAVITIWAVFILSGGLTRTGIANILGRQLLKVAGGREFVLILVIMITVGVLSAFMNNVAVAALMLPVVMDVARKTDRSPSALLMPLAYGSLLGGVTTMIGTPPNILVSEALRENDLTPFGLFDFTPVGIAVMGTGILFVTFIGVKLLPKRRSTKSETGARRDFRAQYELEQRLFRIRIPADSALTGKPLAKSRLGSDFGLNVLSIIRNGKALLAPDPTELLQPGDALIVEGRRERIEEMNHWGQLIPVTGETGLEALFFKGMQVAEVELGVASAHVNQTLSGLGFRNRFGLNVLAIRRDGRLILEEIKNQRLQGEDILVVHGPAEKIVALEQDDDFHSPRELTSDALSGESALESRLHRLKVPAGSGLIGRNLSQSRLGDAVDAQILLVTHEDAPPRVPTSTDTFGAGDCLLIAGDPERVFMLLIRGIEGVFIQDTGRMPDLSRLEDEHTGLVEVVLSPHSGLSGMTLRQLNFREKYGLTVLGIWRKGRAYRSELRDMELSFGDALLLYGRWEKLMLLGREPDFVVLTETAQEIPREEKAGVALTIMAAVILPVILGWVPIYIAVVIGAAVMVMTRCLTMEEAYRYIEWKAVFLIAGMLPLGTALERSGAAQLLAESVVDALGPLGPRAVLFGILAITFMATSIIPTAALVVLMTPIALNTAEGLGISPYALMMGIAMAASSSFTSPISHPANVLVMGPGGYRFVDYLKVGIPLTVLILVVLMVVLPIYWPL